mgnify:CR=1 FL=1
MRHLTSAEVAKFGQHLDVRRIAVENFLMSMGLDEKSARLNLVLDSNLYRWKGATIKAIRDGINLATKRK